MEKLKDTCLPGTLIIRGKTFKKDVNGNYFMIQRGPHKRYFIIFIISSYERKQKLTLKGMQRYCRYYCRFGQCNRGNACQYLHDPSKRTICTKFLRGQCPSEKQCLFSHSPNDNNLPACLLGVQCERKDCRYLHHDIPLDAAICKDFVTFGYCELGRQCAQRHMFYCPEFWETNSCSDAHCKLVKLSRDAFGSKVKSIQSKKVNVADEEWLKLQIQPDFDFVPLDTFSSESESEDDMIEFSEEDEILEIFD